MNTGSTAGHATTISHRWEEIEDAHFPITTWVGSVFCMQYNISSVTSMQVWRQADIWQMQMTWWSTQGSKQTGAETNFPVKVNDVIAKTRPPSDFFHSLSTDILFYQGTWPNIDFDLKNFHPKQKSAVMKLVAESSWEQFCRCAFKKRKLGDLVCDLQAERQYRGLRHFTHSLLSVVQSTLLQELGFMAAANPISAELVRGQVVHLPMTTG